MDKFKVWIKKECPYCDDARNLLLEKRLPHEIVVVDGREDLLREVQAKYGWDTVPVIVEETNEETALVGGYTDLVEHLERKES
jgi:glutaredoxin